MQDLIRAAQEFWNSGLCQFLMTGGALCTVWLLLGLASEPL